MSASLVSSDTLSDLLRAVRLTGAVFFDIEAAAPWAGLRAWMAFSASWTESCTIESVRDSVNGSVSTTASASVTIRFQCRTSFSRAPTWRPDEMLARVTNKKGRKSLMAVSDVFEADLRARVTAARRTRDLADEHHRRRATRRP